MNRWELVNGYIPGTKYYFKRLLKESEESVAKLEARIEELTKDPRTDKLNYLLTRESWYSSRLSRYDGMFADIIVREAELLEAHELLIQEEQTIIMRGMADLFGGAVPANILAKLETR